MLQPSQIDSVLLRFGAEIAEVRGFLRGTGVAVESPVALHEVVQRLEADRAFHRDLGSHAWMLLYGGASVPDTLGVLAVAAAGARFAAGADENDAHYLLRFVMESKNALAGRDSGATRVAAPQPVPAAVDTAVPPAARVSRPVVPIRPEAPQTAVHQPGTLRAITPAIAVPDAVAAEELGAADALPTRHVAEPQRGVAWMPVAVCLLVLAGLGWWLLHRSTPAGEATAKPAPVVDATGAAMPPTRSTTPNIAATAPAVPLANTAALPSSAASASSARSWRPFVTKPSATRESRVTQPVSPQTTSRPSTAAPYTPQRVEQPSARATQTASAPTPSQPVLRAGNAAPAPVTRSASPLIPSSVVASKGAPAPIPASVLSGRLGSPAANQMDAVEDRVEGSKGYPRLLRRKQLDTTGTQMAKNTVPAGINIPVARPVSFTGGTVRSTSLGITAGNLVYAPDPPYPAAAASQHVTGQVTVQAMVDRDGNVASARVVSGPPLLRDAAVNAVSQWRYKPFKAGGKPQTFAATAVVDFQLP